MDADETTLYYHNSNWQVLAETDVNGTTQRWYVYGNYVDEPLMMVAPCLDSTDPSNYYARYFNPAHANGERTKDKRLKVQDNAKPEAAAPIAGQVGVVAVSYPGVVRGTGETAAAENTITSAGWASWIVIQACIIVV